MTNLRRMKMEILRSIVYGYDYERIAKLNTKYINIYIQTVPKYNVLREQKRRHPPLQLTPLRVQGHPGARLVVDLNTINLIEAIFEFPTQT